ncbi:MAG TPA: PfkB family carbohydrate kinase [Pyrinomonadaceae bacterium]|nr:PfkB family carbohydrate kinase [Pyrinomonadaceae bacterium]
MEAKRTPEAERLAGLARSFAGRRVLVVGDLIADQFLFGEISRVSREAPVLILRHERTETVPGGAANCAMNLASLGARASIVGAVGDDEAGRALLARLAGAGVECGGVFVSSRLRTTTKVRVLAGQAHSPRQQVIRVDYESETRADEFAPEIAARLSERQSAAEAVVVSDYDYGVAGAAVVEALGRVAAAREKPVLVDSRFRLREFRGLTSATPNEDEVEHLTGVRVSDAEALARLGEQLRADLGFEALLVTRGRDGMTLVEAGAPPTPLAAVGSHDAVDVTGAGDTVIATYALALAAGANYHEAAALANHAGGIVVLKRGTACVTPGELLASLRDNG